MGSLGKGVNVSDIVKDLMLFGFVEIGDVVLE
jgi:hypothetical protein